MVENHKKPARVAAVEYYSSKKTQTVAQPKKKEDLDAQT